VWKVRIPFPHHHPSRGVGCGVEWTGEEVRCGKRCGNSRPWRHHVNAALADTPLSRASGAGAPGGIRGGLNLNPRRQEKCRVTAAHLAEGVPGCLGPKSQQNGGQSQDWFVIVRYTVVFASGQGGQDVLE
jgi:hypothetical protein